MSMPSSRNVGLSVSIILTVGAVIAVLIVFLPEFRVLDLALGRDAANWILCLRPYSVRDVDAARKALLAIQLASQAEYLESLEPHASAQPLPYQPARGRFSQVQVTRLHGDVATALLHVSATWIPSPATEGSCLAYLDTKLRAVRTVTHIELVEPIRIGIPISGWFLATSEGTLAYEVASQLQPAPAPQPAGKIAVDSWSGGISHIHVVTLTRSGSSPPTTEVRWTPLVSGYCPSWSPDGRMLAFLRKEDDNRDGRIDGADVSQVFVVGSDGTGEVKLTNLPGDKAGVAWSHDGKTIAFCASDDVYQLYAVSADGAGPLTLLYAGLAERTSPSWSPKGNRLAFSTKQDGVLVLDLAEGRLTQLDLPTQPYGSPSWSPSGDAVAVAPYPPETPSQIFVCRLKQGGYRVIEPDANGLTLRPVFSPDGRNIAFLVNHYDQALSYDYSDAYVIDTVSNEQRRLTSGGFFYHAIWSPDSQYVASIKLCDTNQDGLVTPPDNWDFLSTDTDNTEVVVFDIATGAWLVLPHCDTWQEHLSWVSE